MTVSAWWFVGRVCWKSRARDFGHVPEGKKDSTLGSHLLPSLLRLPIPSVHRMQGNMHRVKHRCEAQMNERLPECEELRAPHDGGRMLWRA